jgi:hypothetical protein
MNTILIDPKSPALRCCDLDVIVECMEPVIALPHIIALRLRAYDHRLVRT